jgi:glycosyltransferase involved in cell wall biosynthesis
MGKGQGNCVERNALHEILTCKCAIQGATRMRTTRIVHVIPSLRKGGAERLCLDIARRLNQNSDVETKVVIMRSINEYALEYPDVTPVVVNSSVVPSILGKWKIELNEWDAFVKEFNPNIIHSHLFEAEMMTRYSTMEGVHYFTHCHDNMPQLKRLSWDELGAKHRLTESYERRFLIRQYAACANQFIAISSDTEQYFRSNLPTPLSDTVVRMPNAIDHGRFSAQSASNPTEGGELRLINIGSFVQKKNQRFLLHVLLRLRNNGVNATLTLVGDGPLRQQVEKEALALGLENHVRFVGNVSNVESMLWACHLYVHSASYEPFGLVILEAMAAGLPVVALDGRGNRELHQDGINGYLVKEPDSETFAARIVECTHNIAIWKGMSANSIEFSKQYDIEGYVNRLMRLYSNELEINSN